MSDPFQYGEQVSRAKIMGLLSALQTQGSDILDTLNSAIDVTLSSFNRRFQAMNGRVQRANRTHPATVPVLFLASDFLDIDQGLTTATIRADVRSAHLRERSVPVTAVTKQMRFRPNIGTVEQLDKAGTQFRVHTDNANGQIPTGVFDIQLTESDELTLLVFDIVPTPSVPVIKVEVSNDSIAYSPAQDVSIDADRITAWLAPQAVRFVRLTSTPTHPDELSGTSFTFGVLNLQGSGTDYQLQSELITKPILFSPQTNAAKFVADTVTGASYYMASSLVGVPGTYVEVHPGDVVTIPTSSQQAPTSVGFVGVAWSDPGDTGVSIASTALLLGAYVRPTVPNGFVYQVTTPGTLASSEPTWPLILGNSVISGGVTFTTLTDGILNHILAANAYLQTISVTSDDTGLPVTVAPGLSYLDANILKLTRPYIAITGTQLRYVNNDEALATGKTFTLSYQTGPAQIQVSLKIRLASTDRSVTPIFTGASLEEV